MKRERLEDLGRIRVLLENIDELLLFDFYTGRRKDFVEWFRELDKERQDDMLENLINGISRLEDRLSECIVIARGHDED